MKKQLIAILLTVCLCAGLLPVPAMAASSSAFEAYLQILEQHRNSIDVPEVGTYEWPDGNVTVSDITGDGVAELLFIEKYMIGDADWDYGGRLKIYTFSGGEAKLMLSDSPIIHNYGGGVGYCAFTLAGNKFGLYKTNYNDYISETYLVYSVQGNVLTEVSRMESTTWDDNPSDNRYSLNGTAVTEGQYDAAVIPLFGDTENLLFFMARSAMWEGAYWGEACEMTYAQAVQYLKSSISQNLSENTASSEAAYAPTFEKVRKSMRAGELVGNDGNVITNISECSYALYDIDGNGVSELIFTWEDGAAEVYTLSGGQDILLAAWYGYRHCFSGINERGYIVGYGSNSAFEGVDEYYSITSNGRASELTELMHEYDYTDSDKVTYTLIMPDGKSRTMSKTEGEAYESANLAAPFVELDFKTLTEQSGRITARPTSSAILVNGANVSFDAYNISDNNYFKLRDLAYILSGTEAQFEVEWDAANNAIRLTSGRAYTAVGGEMTGKGSGEKTPVLTSSKILLDGAEISLTAYNIDGNNYFKLRDIGAALDFEIDWDGARNTIVIDTTKGYTAD